MKNCLLRVELEGEVVVCRCLGEPHLEVLGLAAVIVECGQLVGREVQLTATRQQLVQLENWFLKIEKLSVAFFVKHYAF